MHESNRIHILTEETVNKVAAGEVVERPAAALKELLENSLDAGAGQIEVALERAGRGLIRVRDDGEGMSHDEVLLALERHSTSKISDVSDLGRIATFGFRGEALPSLASVSRMQITTRAAGAGEGTRVVISGGKVLKVSPWGAPAGTEVEVRHLFRNVPARLKFLKSGPTELSHCLGAASRLSLANPALGLLLTHGSRRLLRLSPAESPAARLRSYLGRDFFENLLPFEAEEGPLRLSGFIARPGTGRAGAEYQQLFVNRRPVRDPLLAKGIRESCRDYFAGEKGALSFFIWIVIPPGEVDVNVHPTKREIRFRNIAAVRSVLSRRLREVLREDRLAFFRKSAGPFRESAVAEAAGTYDTLPSRDDQLSLEPALHTAPGPDSPSFLPSGQLFGTYLLALRPDGLVLVDQHAAHERVLYERVLKNMDGDRGQELLHPLLLDLTPAEAEVLEELTPGMERFGMTVERFGSGSFRLTALPLPLSGQEAAAFIRELIEKSRKGEATPDVPEFRHHLASTIACHGSVRANQKLRPEEAGALLHDLFQTGDPAHCPHGRPTFIKLERAEIEKRFKRA